MKGAKRLMTRHHAVSRVATPTPHPLPPWYGPPSPPVDPVVVVVLLCWRFSFLPWHHAVLVPVVLVVLSMWFCSSQWTLWLLWSCCAVVLPPCVRGNLCVTVRFTRGYRQQGGQVSLFYNQAQRSW